jgi:hypothetical protein
MRRKIMEELMKHKKVLSKITRKKLKSLLFNKAQEKFQCWLIFLIKEKTRKKK